MGQRRLATQPCRYCGKLFSRRPAAVKKGYCSKDCFYLGRRARVDLIREKCGNPFQCDPSKKDVRRFCSAACSRGMHWSVETNIELAVRQVLEKLGVRFVKEHKISRYALDFYLPDKRIAVEADGDYWHSRPDAIARDRRRDAFLLARGIATVRVPESDLVRGDPLAAIFNRLAAPLAMSGPVQLHLPI